LVYNSALFLACCCCSFSLHVVANLVCNFLVSCQLVLIPALPKFLHSFCSQKCLSHCSERFHLNWCQSFLILLPEGPNFTSI
jgi:hypothetical protein